MSSFAFFFNAGTFEHLRHLSRGEKSVPLSHVGFDNRRPFNSFTTGDELFIVGLSGGEVLLAGRMVVAGPPAVREAVAARTGRDDYIDKPMICLADPIQLDHFRPNLTIPADIAKGLELYTSTGKLTDTSSLRAGRPDPNLFRACPQLSAISAKKLRALLDIGVASAPAGDDDDVSAAEGFDSEEYRVQAIKTRRGQKQFRQNLLDAYGRRCMITSCKVEALLEAAHITPHAELTDYEVSNGLLLRADIHTLFDLDLVTIDEFYRVSVSEELRYSEYWTYNGRRIERFPEKTANQPNRDSLRARAARLKGNR